MKKIIKKILKEDRRQEYLNKIINFMKNDFPLIKNLKDYGFYDQLSAEELYYVFSEIFDQPVEYDDDRIYDENGNKIYYESSNGFWYRKEFDENGDVIYFENSYGFWKKWEYDNRGNRIYYEDCTGYIEDER